MAENSGEKRFAGYTFEQVVSAYADTITGVCIMRLQNSTDSEDCFQNVFFKLYYNSPDFENENHLKAWLIRVAINECTSYRRKNSRHISLDNLHNEPFFDHSDSMDISWALMKTPPKYRDVLYLHYCQEYKVKEIAQILSLNESTVKSRLKRGRKILKSVYGGDNT